MKCRKQVPRDARNDRKKGKGNGGGGEEDCGEDGAEGMGELSGFGVLRLRDCKVRNRSAQDDRFVLSLARSRFLALLGMTERKARARSRFLALLGMTERKARARSRSFALLRMTSSC